MKRILITIFFTLLLVSFKASAQDSITLTNDNGVSIEIDTVVIYERINRLKPDESIFPVMFFTIKNDSTRRACVFARDIRLIIDDIEYAPINSLMRELQNTLEPKRDFVGAIRGQCINQGEDALSFAAFDTPELPDSLIVRYYEVEVELDDDIVETPKTANRLSMRPTREATETESAGMTLQRATPTETPSRLNLTRATATPPLEGFENSEEYDDDFDAELILSGLYIFLPDTEITSVQIVNNRPKGGKRNVIIAYRVSSDDELERLKEVVQMLALIGGFEQGDDLNVDDVTLFQGDAQGELISLITASTDDVAAFLEDEIEIEELVSRIRFLDDD